MDIEWRAHITPLLFSLSRKLGIYAIKKCIFFLKFIDVFYFAIPIQLGLVYEYFSLRLFEWFTVFALQINKLIGFRFTFTIFTQFYIKAEYFIDVVIFFVIRQKYDFIRNSILNRSIDVNIHSIADNTRVNNTNVDLHTYVCI